MPSNLTTIPAPRALLVDPATGVIATEWYRFLFNIYTLSGSGSNAVTLDELQIGPPTQPATGGGGTSGTVTSVATGTGLTGGPITTTGTINFAVAAVGTWAATPSSANLLAAMTDETGTGSLVFATSPTLVTPLLGTPTSGNFSTGTFTWPTFNQNTTGYAASLAGGLVGSLPYQSALNTTTFLAAGTNGQVLTLAAGVPSWATPTTGTVTSVTGTSPVDVATGTTTPVVSLASKYGDTQNPYASKTANYVLAAPNGSAGAPTFRALVSGDVTGLGTMATQNANAVAITGGAIDGTTIGATTATTGAFTTVTASTSVTTPIVQATNSAGLALKNASGTTQISMGAGGGDNASINVSTNINGTNAQIDISPTGTGHVHIKPTGVNSVEIAPTNVGTMDNMTIGATTAKNGSFVDLSVTGTTSFDGSQGTAGQVLTSAGTGATPTWATPTTGTVTSVTGTAPVVSSGGATPAISMPAATTSVDGYLTSTDWNTFNNKQPAGTYVNSVSGTAGRITSTGGATPVIDLVSGIATPGTTGSATLIPVVTIDTYGRVTSITTAANPQGTVTSVGGTGTVNGITLTGTVTSSGNLTLGGTLSGVSLTTQVSGTLPILNGGTGQTTAGAAFNALSPITTAGDLILGNGVNSATRLAIGTSTYVLTSNGTTASWAAPAAGGSNITALGLWENNKTISVNYAIASGNSATSAGPITISSGVSVTVPSGSRWVVL
jgi:hypothetical protein